MLCLVVLAGPNGTGKSTLDPLLLRDELRVTEFLNADVIAAGLSAFAPERAAISAGRAVLARAKELAARGETFALETRVASRSLAPWIGMLRARGYGFHLVFLWLPSPELALGRVLDRVRRGGHDVKATVLRRYESGLKNLFRLFRPMATTWRVLDASGGRRDSERPTSSRRRRAASHPGRLAPPQAVGRPHRDLARRPGPVGAGGRDRAR